MYDVFLSYRRESGSEFASFLNNELCRLGYTVFFDAISLREGVFEERIDNAIDQCTFFLVLLANNDLDRSIEDPENDWIIHETKRALENGKIIIPIAIKKGFAFPADCNNDVIERLSKYNMCDLSGVNAVNLIETKLIGFMNDYPAKKLAADYNNGVTDPSYIAWELETLKGIYYDIPFVNVFGRDYPAYTVEGAEEIKYPFETLTLRKNLSSTCEAMPYEDGPWYDDFKKIVGPNIHYPRLYGYTSNGFELDENGKIKSIISTPRTYRETVYTCHVLQYELWSVYNKLEGKRPATLEDLPMRKAIHEGKSNIEVIMSGCNRSALNDVNIAIIDYNDRIEEYTIATAIRADTVATFPNYFGFVPSGGFELYELETNQSDTVIRENFSVIGALFREYVEEIFGDSEFEKATGDDDLNRLYRNGRIRNLRAGVKNGTYKFEFLGVDFDLITLRQTLAFVLRIDDENFFYDSRIKKNSENVFIRFEPLRTLESRITDESLPVMTETAATYNLLKNHRIYKEIVDNDYRLV